MVAEAGALLGRQLPSALPRTRLVHKRRGNREPRQRRSRVSMGARFARLAALALLLSAAASLELVLERHDICTYSNCSWQS